MHAGHEILPKTSAIAALLVVLVTSTGIRGVAAQDAAAQGERIYDNYCATCHGEQLQNSSGGLTFDLRRLTRDDYPRFVNSVLNGKDRMPPWQGVLAQKQIDEIWAYIRANVER